MIKLIAETAWHHEGDFSFMEDLIYKICEDSLADVVKMHITLDLDEYMSNDHEAFNLLNSWMLTAEQWERLISIVRDSGKELMLLVNDTVAIEFAAQFSPEYIELHSVCLNIRRLQCAILEKIHRTSKIVIGVGGCNIQEVDSAVQVFKDRFTILMFGFQNFPTKYEDVNLRKIRKIQALYANKEFGYADHTAWDEDNNELITLLVASNGMGFIEKHVTTVYGQDRCDSSAAISIDMFNNIARKINLLRELNDNGSLELNHGEKLYSQYGPMKMAAMAIRDMKKEETLKESDMHFCRTSNTTDFSQIEMYSQIGKKLTRNVNQGDVFNRSDFE